MFYAVLTPNGSLREVCKNILFIAQYRWKSLEVVNAPVWIQVLYRQQKVQVFCCQTLMNNNKKVFSGSCKIKVIKRLVDHT
jgi:hypothetical protein